LKHGKYQKDAIVIAMVSCNQERTEQSFLTLKSAVLFTKKHIHFVIMADEINKKYLNEQMLAEWPESILERISFEIHPVKFPGPEEDEMEWRKLFKPCASQRLFLPSLLKHIDSVLYVDNDVLFLTSPEEIWQFFDKMNSTQMAAAAPESEDYAVGWYNRFAKHPFVAPLGINSGVMLMNLTRLRDFRWETFLQPVLRKYKLDIVWGDQDIINIIFHFNTDKLFTFPCQWNYRPDHCIYSQVCKEITDTGVKILHGNRNAFTEEKLPFFRAIYLTIKAYNFRTDVLSNLLEPLTQRLYLTESTNCGKHQRLITKTLVANILNNTI
jgi:UDP-xylose:glucoside alpha-1,3-xylosyltransferase